jgi:hypothetical protein
MAFMLALRAASDATELALAEAVEVAAPIENPENPETVPATALLDWVPLTVPPVELT